MKKKKAAFVLLVFMAVSVLCLPVTVFAESVTLPDGYIEPINYYTRNNKKVGGTLGLETSVKDAGGYYVGLEYVRSTSLGTDNYEHLMHYPHDMYGKESHPKDEELRKEDTVYNSIQNMKWERDTDNGSFTLSGTTEVPNFSYSFNLTFSNIRFGILVDEKGNALDFNAGQVYVDVKGNETTTGKFFSRERIIDKKDLVNSLVINDGGVTYLDFFLKGECEDTANGGISVRFRVYGIKYKGGMTVIVDADDERGEFGVAVPAAIIVGSLGAAAAVAGAALAGSSGGSSKHSAFSMCVNKNFDDKLEPGDKPRPVFARIVEHLPGGGIRPRPDLTPYIRVFSGDGKLVVRDGGVRNGYRAALVSADVNTYEDKGMLSFRFEGKGGAFTEHVVFKIIQPEILFGQDNLGLPAHHEKEVELHFALMNMPDDTAVEAKIISPKNARRYSLELTPDEKQPRLYGVKLRDISPKDEADAGTTERHVLRVKATIRADANRNEREVEKDFEIFRIHMGLVLSLEANAIGCYLVVNDGHDEMARNRAAGSELGESLMTPAAALNPMGAVISSGTGAMIDIGTSANVNSWERHLNYTTGRIMLFFWDEEKQEVMRVPVIPDKDVAVKALYVDNDKNALIGKAQERHQELVKSLGISVARTKDIDDKGMRLVKLCATTAALDRPTRIRAEITVRAVFRKNEYTVKKKVLLHSMPFRQISTPEEHKAFADYDSKIEEQLMRVKSKLRGSNRLEHYLPLYNLIDRMLTGYDFAFGYDQRQVERVMNTWLRIVQGKLAGMNEDAEKVSLADDIAAIYAFMQGMRDNGGILGRVALGICTYGYSEYLFFAMDLGEKMQAAVYAVRGDKDFGFWDGVKMGLEEYEKQLLVEALVLGANVGYGKIHAKFHGGYEKDLLGTIASKYRAKMHSIDSALRSKSPLYGKTAKTIDSVAEFTNSSARRVLNAMNSHKENLAASGQRADGFFGSKPDPSTMTPEQLRLYENYKLSMQRAENEIFELRRLMKEHGTSRASGDLAEADKALEDYICSHILQHKGTYNMLNNLDDPFAATMRSEVTRVRNMKIREISNMALDDIALTLGKNRADLYIDSATSNKEWRALAGERGCMPNDFDMSGMELNRSDPTKSVVIDQTVGENALSRATYKAFHGGAEPPDIDVAKRFAKKVDNTYVSPWMDQGNKYEIEWNPEAYSDLKALTDPSHYGDELRGSGLDKKAFEHKVSERVDMSVQCDAEAEALMEKANAATGAEREAYLYEANELRCQSADEWVEGGRQLGKVKKIIDGRSILNEAETGSSTLTNRVNDINSVVDRLKQGAEPVEVEKVLSEQFGTDLKGAAKETANCLI